MFFPKSRGLLNGLRPRIWEPVSCQDGTVGYKATSRAMLSLKRILTHTDTKYVWTKLDKTSSFQKVALEGPMVQLSAGELQGPGGGNVGDPGARVQTDDVFHFDDRSTDDFS